MKKIIFIVVGFLLFLIVYGKINKEVYEGIMDSTSNVMVDFDINKGDGPTEIGKKLTKEGLIRDKYYFWYYVWRTKTDTKLQAGKYSIAKNMTIAQMVDIFSGGKVKPEIVKLTVPEGSSNDKIIKLLEEKKPEIVNEFREIVKCKCLNKPDCTCDKFSSKYGFIEMIPAGGDLEGYLFPDTYFISKDEIGETLVAKFLENFNKKINSSIKDSIRSQKKTLHEIITLASIVEREAKKSTDRPIVAGVFWNRLKIGHALQSDATLSYILGVDKMKYYQEDMDKESPYNTYKNVGLPPGPISNPGLESVSATIHPADTEYFYFLNDVKTEETVFAKTFAEHKINKTKHGL